VRIAYFPVDPDLASARYRQALPGAELARLGYAVVDIPDAAEVGIFTKHEWNEALLDRYPHTIFDICDDHFGDKRGDFYRRVCMRAGAITCNSEAMRFRIFQETRRVATVIPDPYELDEVAPSWGEGLLWFGHHRNLEELHREMPELRDHRITVVTGGGLPRTVPWSKENLLRELAACAVVILPTGRSPCKSANRLIEATRRGKHVVANPLPAYEPFAPDVFIGSIREGVDRAHRIREDLFPSIRSAQARVAREFSPALIAQQWREVIGELTRGKIP